MNRIIITTAVICSLALFGCDIDRNSLGATEESASPATIDATDALAKAGAADITVGADVSIWDSNHNDPDPTDGIAAIGGNGQINGGFTTAESDGIQIALRAQQRFEGPLEPSGSKVGVYQTETGSTESNNAIWNYDWHVDLRGTGTTLKDYDLTLQSSNTVNEIFGLKTPIDLTHLIEGEFGPGTSDNVELYQQSFNPGFGNDTFDPTEEDTYNLTLRLSPKAGGPPLSVKIQVVVNDAS